MNDNNSLITILLNKQSIEELQICNNSSTAVNFAAVNNNNHGFFIFANVFLLIISILTVAISTAFLIALKKSQAFSPNIRLLLCTISQASIIEGCYCTVKCIFAIAITCCHGKNGDTDLTQHCSNRRMQIFTISDAVCNTLELTTHVPTQVKNLCVLAICCERYVATRISNWKRVGKVSPISKPSEIIFPPPAYFQEFVNRKHQKPSKSMIVAVVFIWFTPFVISVSKLAILWPTYTTTVFLAYCDDFVNSLLYRWPFMAIVNFLYLLLDVTALCFVFYFRQINRQNLTRFYIDRAHMNFGDRLQLKMNIELTAMLLPSITAHVFLRVLCVLSIGVRIRFVEPDMLVQLTASVFTDYLLRLLRSLSFTFICLTLYMPLREALPCWLCLFPFPDTFWRQYTIGNFYEQILQIDKSTEQGDIRISKLTNQWNKSYEQKKSSLLMIDSRKNDYKKVLVGDRNSAFNGNRHKNSKTSFFNNLKLFKKRKITTKYELDTAV